MKERIKQIRKAAGLNQEAFGQDLGLSRSMVVKVENGDAVFSDRTIRDICRIYNVNEAWLRTGEGEPYVPKSRNEHLADFLNSVMEEEPESYRRRWIEVLSKLSVEDWELLDRMAREYVNKKED